VDEFALESWTIAEATDGIMSLRGRLIIDQIKRAVSSYFSLPVPPYGNPSYWEGCYRSLGPNDSFEWGHISFEDLHRYQYRELRYDPVIRSDATKPQDPHIQTTFGDTLRAYPHSPADEHILILGCGNSKFGESMVEHGWNGPIVQVDVASRVIESMSQRCQEQQRKGDMLFVQDDATVLSAFHDDKATAVFDKGLLDALFCADEYQQCFDIMSSIHRVLQPGGVYAFLSFSRPQFLMDKILLPPGHEKRKGPVRNWANIQIRQLDTILLYRFQKAMPETVRKPNRKRGHR
jgi:ubiquinone/menaquinone biosynthesis C-methylase UbiE